MKDILKNARNFIIFYFVFGALAGFFQKKDVCAFLEKSAYHEKIVLIGFFGDLGGCQLRWGFQYP
jgi:hypothetical protein